MNFSHKGIKTFSTLYRQLHWFNKVTIICRKYKTIQLKGLVLYYFVTFPYNNGKCILRLLFDNGSPATISNHF